MTDEPSEMEKIKAEELRIIRRIKEWNTAFETNVFKKLDVLDKRRHLNARKEGAHSAIVKLECTYRNELPDGYTFGDFNKEEIDEETAKVLDAISLDERTIKRYW